MQFFLFCPFCNYWQAPGTPTVLLGLFSSFCTVCCFALCLRLPTMPRVSTTHCFVETWVWPLNISRQNPWGHYVIWETMGSFLFSPVGLSWESSTRTARSKTWGLSPTFLKVAARSRLFWRHKQAVLLKAGFRKPPRITQLLRSWLAGVVLGYGTSRACTTCLQLLRLEQIYFCDWHWFHALIALAKEMGKQRNISPQRGTSAFPARRTISVRLENCRKRSAEGRC